jgi:hypothetical protein
MPFKAVSNDSTEAPAVDTATAVEGKPTGNVSIDGRIVSEFVDYLKTLPVHDDVEVTLEGLKKTPKIREVWVNFAQVLEVEIPEDTVIYEISLNEKGQYVSHPVYKRSDVSIILTFPKGFSIVIPDAIAEALIILERKLIYKPLKLAIPVALVDGEKWDKDSAFSDLNDLFTLISEDLEPLKFDADTKDFQFTIVEIILEGVSKKNGEPYKMVKVRAGDKNKSYFLPDAKGISKESFPLAAKYIAAKKVVVINGKEYSTVSVLPFNKLAENTTYIVEAIKAEANKFKPSEKQYILSLKDPEGRALKCYSSAPISRNISSSIPDADKYNEGTEKMLIFTKKTFIGNNAKASLAAQLDIPASYPPAFFGSEQQPSLPW